jgi:UDP-N-acetylglucosamine--dolichyl-phosphate N-acetylglucosaminephosphotransferase
MPECLKVGMVGKDINKKGEKEGEIQIPECLGIVPAIIYLIISAFTVLYTKQFHEDMLLYHVSAISSICFIIMLGFLDDVFDLRWKYKWWVPAIASLPLLVAYQGETFIVLPMPLRMYFGKAINLGVFYYVYMILVSIFCTHSINIYAGINGLEVGQSLVIACSILTHNAIEISRNADPMINSKHIFSILLIISYIFVTLALYQFNKYPSQVFIGDTFCYWSGMVFATAGILG